jgi:FtsH-binding integral membrane protein
MIEPSLYEKLHWALFNFLARVFAYGLVLVCCIFLLLVAANVAGKPIGAQSPPWLVVLFVPLLVVGVLMTRAKPYYPEKFKEWYERGRNRSV